MYEGNGLFNCLMKMLQVMAVWALIILSQPVFGQEIPDKDINQWLLKAQIFAQQVRVIDNKFSSIPLLGTIPGGELSTSLTKKNTQHELGFAYSQGNPDFSGIAGSGVKLAYFNADYTFMYLLKHPASSPLRYKAGAGINVLYSKRDYNNFINSDVSFELVTSLSSNIEVVYLAKGKLTGISVSNRIQLPFISILQQPAYATDGPEGSPDQKGLTVNTLFKGSELVSFSSFFRATNHLTIAKKLTERNGLSLVYIWNYYHIKTMRQVKSASHRLGFTYYHIL